MAFDPMSENLVEENARCPAGEDRRPHERFGLRRFEELGGVVGHAVNRRQQNLVVGKAVRVDCLEGLESLQVGAVGRFGGGGNHHARESAAMHQAAAFGIDEVFGFALRRDRNVRGQHAGVILKARRELTHTGLPGLFVEFQLRRRRDRDHRRLVGKIVGIVGLGDTHLGVGLDADQTLGGELVGAVRIQPQKALDGIDAVFKWQRDTRCESARRSSVGTAHAMVVVELGRSHAHRSIETAGSAIAVGLERSQGCGEGMALRFRHFVA